MTGQLVLFEPGWSGHRPVELIETMTYEVDGAERTLTWIRWSCTCGRVGCEDAWRR
jgi:hypothetical protein